MASTSKSNKKRLSTRSRRLWNFDETLGGSFATDLPDRVRKEILDPKEKRRDA